MRSTRTHELELSLLERVGFRMVSRLHEMCEFLEFDGADYRFWDAPGAPTPADLLTLYKNQKRPSRGVRRRAAGQLKAQGAHRAGRRAVARRQGGYAVTDAVLSPAPQEAASPVGLYVHVPFCESICTYCNFTRGLLDDDLARRYVEAVVREIEQVERPGEADTVYFGGGTPSVLEPDDIGRIVAACRTAWSLSEQAEITMEANPESATDARLAGYREAGVTRLSPRGPVVSRRGTVPPRACP